MHGDLAARNILIGAGYEAKIRKQNKSTIYFFDFLYEPVFRIKS